MAYRLEKETGDIVISGFEQGIAPSPHKGLANIQNANISTEMGEIMASFNRTAQLTSSFTPVSGTLTASGGDGNYILASNTALSVGQWINVTAATVQVPKTSETVSLLAVGGAGGGGGTAASVTFFAGGGGAGQFLSNASLSVGVKAYTITVGSGGSGGTTAGTDGGSGGTSSITHVSGVTVISDATAIGGGGGGGVPSGADAGVGGASGGGGGATNVAGAAGGVGSAGHNGAAGIANTSGGGGGGASTAGSGSTGGTGSSSSISGGAVTYAAGGAGGTAGNGSAGTANTGNGGGGGGGSSKTGGAGGSGVVIISYTTGNITATGGSITTSGGNTIHTFNSSGTFTITSINTTQNMSTGYYFVDYSAAGPKVKISSSYDPSGANPFFHGTSGTISFTTVGQFGKPLAKATETYASASTYYNRYYVLDSTGQVWVNDTFNALGWILTSPDVTYFGSQAAPSGMTILNGFLLLFAGASIFGKPTINLGTAFTDIGNDASTTRFGTNTVPHFAYTGHQGRAYYCDGNYIGSIFPDTSIQTGGNNVQSYCSYTAVTSTGTITAIFTGSAPQIPIGATYRVPTVFFTDAFGTMPTALTTGVVYWIGNYAPSTGHFRVYGENTTSSLTTTGALSTGDVSATLNAAWTEVTKIEPVQFSNSDVRDVQFTNGSAAITWATGLSGSATTGLTIGANPIDIQTGSSGSMYFNTFYPIGADAASGGLTPTTSVSTQRLNLPAFEIAQCMAEIGNTLLIGCRGNVVYPWNQIDATPSSIISLPESDTANIVTVNQMGYIFAGHKGSVYITDGSVASQVIKVPDYAAGVPGSPGTYVEPVFTWGDAMYLRGRVWFSILDQTSTKAGNCGGIWSFTPTQNLYIGNDAGISLRLENQNSYNTYNGYAPILLPRYDQPSGNPLYWTGWWADITGTSYGIDYSNTGTNSSFPFVLETDAIPVGTMTNKKTFKHIEYKLSAPLDTGATIALKYRPDMTSAWKSAGPLTKDQPSLLSGYFTVEFEKGQWLQLQLTATPITSTATTNTFVRLSELRVR